MKRFGVIGIVLEKPNETARDVNQIISQYSYLIIGRMGVPKHEEKIGLIALIIEGTTDEVGAFTGKLGNLSGVTVKSALTKKQHSKEGLSND